MRATERFEVRGSLRLQGQTLGLPPPPKRHLRGPAFAVVDFVFDVVGFGFAVPIPGFRLEDEGLKRRLVKVGVVGRR